MNTRDMDIYVRKDPHVHALQLADGREDGWIAVIHDANGQHIVGRAHTETALSYALQVHPGAQAHPIVAVIGLDTPLAMGDWIVSDGIGYTHLGDADFQQLYGPEDKPKTKAEVKADVKADAKAAKSTGPGIETIGE